MTQHFFKVASAEEVNVRDLPKRSSRFWSTKVGLVCEAPVSVFVISAIVPLRGSWNLFLTP